MQAHRAPMLGVAAAALALCLLGAGSVAHQSSRERAADVAAAQAAEHAANEAIRQSSIYLRRYQALCAELDAIHAEIAEITALLRQTTDGFNGEQLQRMREELRLLKQRLQRLRPEPRMIDDRVVNRPVQAA